MVSQLSEQLRWHGMAGSQNSTIQTTISPSASTPGQSHTTRPPRHFVVAVLASRCLRVLKTPLRSCYVDPQQPGAV